MTITQNIYHRRINKYDNNIQITDIPKSYFPAIIRQFLPPDSDTREVEIELLPLEQSPGGTMTANPGGYPRRKQEIAVKVTVSQDGKVLATDTHNYPEPLPEEE